MKKNASSGAVKRPRVKKADWLNSALELLCDSGIESVRVEVLAERLGVAKSGFYYHFTNRQQLFDALLNYWIEFEHMPMMELEKMGSMEPRDALVNVIKVVDKYDLGKLDFAIRQWAHSDKKVRKAYNLEMKERIELNKELFAAMGFKGDDLEMRTRVFVAYVTTERQVFPNLTNKERWNLRDRQLAMLTRRD